MQRPVRIEPYMFSGERCMSSTSLVPPVQLPSLTKAGIDKDDRISTRGGIASSVRGSKRRSGEAQLDSFVSQVPAPVDDV